VLVLLGVRLDGTKELIALAEGLREPTECWADLLRDCRRRGMLDPELGVGDQLTPEQVSSTDPQLLTITLGGCH
jgi:transposase-like protein